MPNSLPGYQSVDDPEVRRRFENGWNVPLPSTKGLDNHEMVDAILAAARGQPDQARALRELLADVFPLYLKTKNFHWHMSGRHFRDYHLLLDEHGDQLFAMTDEIAERARKIGGTILHSIGDISAHQRLADNNQEVVSPDDMLGELLADNRRLTGFLRVTHETCGRLKDVALPA